MCLIGAPVDWNSSYLRGCAEAPPRVRKMLFSDMGNPTTELGLVLGEDIDITDAGDLRLTPDDAHEQIRGAILTAAAGGDVPIALGGDHSITYPAVEALASLHGPLQILHVDAHPDLYADFGGNPASHASPFARIMEAGLASRLVQVGIRALNRHQREQADRFGVEVIEMRTFAPEAVPLPSAPLYVTIDLDGLDPAYAPGVSHPEPGGLSTRDLLHLLHRLPGSIVGADVVELNPTRDVNDVTATLAAKLVKELAALTVPSRP